MYSFIPQTFQLNYYIHNFSITMMTLMSKIFSTTGLWTTKFTSSSNNLINNQINNLILLS